MYYYFIASIIKEGLDKHFKGECHITESNPENIQSFFCKTFTKEADEYYIFIVNDETLEYIGHSYNNKITAISTDIIGDSNILNRFRLHPIDESFKGLKNNMPPSHEAFGKIIGELIAIDSVDKIFSYPSPFEIEIKINKE